MSPRRCASATWPPRPQARLPAVGIADAEAALDAELLLRHVLDWDRATWLTRRDEPATAPAADEFTR